MTPPPPPDQARDLARLVKRCRDAQKAYFRNRFHDDLLKSKGLEALVDRAVEAILHPQPGELFDWREDGP